MEAFVQRVGVDEALKAAAGVGMAPGGQLGLVQTFVGDQPKLVEPHRGAHCPRLVAELGESVASPEVEGLLRQLDGRARVCARGRARCKERFEAPRVEVLGVHVDPVAPGARTDGGLRRQRPA